MNIVSSLPKMAKRQHLLKAKAAAIIFLVCTFAACKKENRWDCIKRSGEQITETRVLPPVSSVFLNDNIDIYITQGATQEVKIVAGKNLVSLVNTEVINGELHISNSNKCNWARSYKKGMIAVYVTLPTLTYVENNGSGKIKSQNIISCDNIRMKTSESGDIELSVNATQLVYIACLGSSDITLHGNTTTLGIFHGSEGYLYCEDLQADNAWTQSKASGNEYLNVKNYLKVDIDWAGDVYFAGNPSTIEENVIGKGRLIHTN